MTTKEEVKRIIDKYNESFSELSNNGTAKEFKTVMKYIADQANKRQRQSVGWKRLRKGLKNKNNSLYSCQQSELFYTLYRNNVISVAYLRI